MRKYVYKTLFLRNEQVRRGPNNYVDSEYVDGTYVDENYVDSNYVHNIITT